MKKTKTAAERIERMIDGIHEVLEVETLSQEEMFAAVTEVMLDFGGRLKGDPLMMDKQKVARYFIDMAMPSDQPKKESSI